MCRSGNAPDTTRADKTEPPPDMSFRANAVSRGIYSSCKFILRWFINPRGGFLHSADATVGMTKMGDVFWYYQKQFRPFGRGTAHRPFPTVSLLGGFFQPHGLYSKRGGRQIAAPTVTLGGGTVQPHGFFSLRFRNGT